VNKIKETKFKGLFIFHGQKHKDSRGYLRELVIEKKIKQKFKFQIISKSKKNVLRGFKKAQGKHISVIKGEIFDVAVDLRKNSPTYKKVFTERLSEKNTKSIYIPAGFAHGFLTLGKENIVCYSCTEYRSIGNEYGLAYNDPALKIKWPRNKIIITKKDKFAKNLSDLIIDKII
jgi:dTDP-4-dehydrorhamnose 3,5-epimerase